MTQLPVFSELDWRAACTQLAGEASAGCGSSHDLYVARFSGAVNARVAQLAASDRPKVLEIAKEWDYATAQELDQTQADLADNGYCCHGIELGCCPVGCE